MDKLNDVFPRLKDVKKDLPEGMTEVAPKPGAVNKYGNRKIKYDGFVFDSLKEACRWRELQTLAKEGKVDRLERQVRIPCVINDVKVFTYIADFQYFELVKDFPWKWHPVIEDSKGMKTDIYKLKIKVLKACYPGFEVLET